jgi:hypothetical protein
MLGSGDPELEDWMRSTESNFKDKFRGWVGFSVPVSHRITAGYANNPLPKNSLVNCHLVNTNTFYTYDTDISRFVQLRYIVNAIQVRTLWSQSAICYAVWYSSCCSCNWGA